MFEKIKISALVLFLLLSNGSLQPYCLANVCNLWKNSSSNQIKEAVVEEIQPLPVCSSNNEPQHSIRSSCWKAAVISSVVGVVVGCVSCFLTVCAGFVWLASIIGGSSRRFR